MVEKKILIVTYYWPPSGGSGVQRWLKFVKYLPSFGWKPYVFTPENPSFETKDESLVKDIPPEAVVIRFPIWEPYSLFNKLSGKKKNSETLVPGGSKLSLFQKIATWVRGNFFIPDPRFFWVRPSVQFLNHYLKENQITTLITTGPPHSVHLIGLKLKAKNPSLKWLADFRDPWSEWGFLDSIRAGTFARWFHRKLEQNVLKSADEIITITPFYVKQFERLSGRKVNLLTNGYDEEDFREFTLKRPDKFLVRHVGVVNEKCDPRPLMKAVANVCRESMELQESLVIEFVGSVHPAFQEFVFADKVLSDITVFTPAVPHHDLMDIYASSAVLLLILTGYKDAAGYMPGKLFEYVATGLPILGVGPVDGDAAALLMETKSGRMIASEDEAEIKSTLWQLFSSWKEGKMLSESSKAVLYSRKEITGKLASFDFTLGMKHPRLLTHSILLYSIRHSDQRQPCQHSFYMC
jgi:glycosyltransferase involved in cell wall biosynthesis